MVRKILIFLILVISISISFSQSFKQQELNRDILIKASYFYNIQRYELTKDLLSQALKGISYPEDLYRIRYMYAKTMFKLYNFSDGINSLENILFISPDKYSASFLLKRLDFLKNFKRSDPPKSLVFMNSINGFDYKNNVEYFYNPISVTLNSTDIYAIDPANKTLITTNFDNYIHINKLSVATPTQVAAINKNIFILSYGNKVYNLTSGASVTLKLPILMKSYMNKLWVYDLMDSTFRIYGSDLKEIFFFKITNFPFKKILIKDFTVDSYSKTLYVLDETFSRIEKLDFSGRILAFKNFIPLFSSVAFSPQSLDIDNFGNLYISDYDGDLMIFNTNLDLVKTLSLKNNSFSMSAKNNFLLSSDYVRNTINIYQVLYEQQYLFPKIDYVDVSHFPIINVYVEIYDKFSNPFPEEFGYLKLTDNKVGVDYKLTNTTYSATNVLVIGDDLKTINKISDSFSTMAINKSSIVQAVLKMPFNFYHRALVLIDPETPSNLSLSELAYFLFLHNVSLYVISDTKNSFYNTLTKMTGGGIFLHKELYQLINDIKSKMYNMIKLQYTTPFVRKSTVDEVEVDFKYQNFISMDSIIYSKNWINEIR